MSELLRLLLGALVLGLVGIANPAAAQESNSPRCFAFPWPPGKSSGSLLLVLRETSSRLAPLEARLGTRERRWQRGFSCLKAAKVTLDCIGADDSGRFTLELDDSGPPRLILRSISFGDPDEPGPSFVATEGKPPSLSGVRKDCPSSP